jgi:hypothetical protein
LIWHFETVDKLSDNPFRPDLKGRSRIYFVAPDDEYFLAQNDRTGAHFVTASKSQKGFKRLRAEIASWHYPPEERGKPVPKMRPKPIFDDIITTIRYALARWGVASAALTPSERVESQMQPGMRRVDIPMLPAEQQSQAIVSNQIWTGHFVAEEEERSKAVRRKVTFRK